MAKPPVGFLMGCRSPLRNVCRGPRSKAKDMRCTEVYHAGLAPRHAAGAVDGSGGRMAGACPGPWDGAEHLSYFWNTSHPHPARESTSMDHAQSRRHRRQHPQGLAQSHDGACAGGPSPPPRSNWRSSRSPSCRSTNQDLDFQPPDNQEPGFRPPGRMGPAFRQEDQGRPMRSCFVHPGAQPLGARGAQERHRRGLRAPMAAIAGTAKPACRRQRLRRAAIGGVRRQSSSAPVTGPLSTCRLCSKPEAYIGGRRQAVRTTTASLSIPAPASS